MTFEQQLYLLLIDKGVLAVLAFTLWHFYSRQKERTSTEMSEAIALLERQLSDFYWPMKYHLETDSALWERVPALSDDATLPEEAGRALERDAVIPNHEAALEVIEKGFGLIASDTRLTDAVVRYVRHVTVYRALRCSNQDLNPIDVEEPFPPDLHDLVETGLVNTQYRLETLRRERWRSFRTEANGTMQPALRAAVDAER